MNSLNKQYKDNVSQYGEAAVSISSPSRIGVSSKDNDGNEDDSHLIGKHGLQHEKLSYERTQKNALLINDQIKMQTKRRSLERTNEKLEAIKSTKSQIEHYDRIDRERERFLHKITQLNNHILDKHKDGNHANIHVQQ